MKILFCHPTIPSQYKHLCKYYAGQSEHEVVFVGHKKNTEIAGVQQIYYQLARDPNPNIHRYLASTEQAVLRGQAAWRVYRQLRDKQGFIPDIICAHPGWGDVLYIKELFPDTPILNYCEFYYQHKDGDWGFDPEYSNPKDADSSAQILTKNIVNLLNLDNMDWGISPTQWQRSTHPSAYQHKISVLHDGIDTNVAKPDPNASFQLPNGKKLTASDRIITYAARHLEPYRGFHSFIRASKKILDTDKQCQIVIVGTDQGKGYGPAAPPGKSYKQLLAEEVQYDQDRVHFVGLQPHSQLIKLFQISSAHIYLTYPFVLSWSALEAMACGCAMVMSDTAPVNEIATHNHNAKLVNFFDYEQIADTLLETINDPDQNTELRYNARDFILRNYSLEKILPTQIQLINQIANRQLPILEH